MTGHKANRFPDKVPQNDLEGERERGGGENKERERESEKREKEIPSLSPPLSRLSRWFPWGHPKATEEGKSLSAITLTRKERRPPYGSKGTVWLTLFVNGLLKQLRVPGWSASSNIGRK